MVAMFGWTIPDPLAMPVNVTVFPPISHWMCRNFGWVSVVIIAREARSHASIEESQTFKALGIASQMDWTGKGSPITPVENGQMASSETSVKDARDETV